jgi:IstB-like ATP binding protein
MVFQLVSRRYERGTMIITSNKSFTEWGGVLGDDVLATAILDLLTTIPALLARSRSFRRPVVISVETTITPATTP